jgi:hypothetical protein
VNGIALSRVLDALARSESLVPSDTDRITISRAAEAISALDRQPLVLVCGNGPLADPVFSEVEYLSDSVRTMADDLHEVADHVEDVLRLLRKQRNESAGEAL